LGNSPMQVGGRRQDDAVEWRNMLRSQGRVRDSECACGERKGEGNAEGWTSEAKRD
jgi:hypothetical protein